MILQVSIHFRVLYRIVCLLLYTLLVCFLVLLPYMHNYLLPICTFIYTVALRGGNTTPSLVADAFCRV
jgi:hypothetical protein